MKKLAKEKKERILLIVIGTAIICVGGWYGVVNAQKAKLKTTEKTIEEQQGKVSNAQRLLKNKAEIAARLQNSATHVKEIEGGMASGDMYSWVILTVNKFKAGYEVDIPQFSREVTGEVGVLPNFPYRAATFTLRGTAYFHEFGKFLADFENEFPYIRVQNIELEPASGTVATTAEDPEKLAFKMELVTLINPTVY